MSQHARTVGRVALLRLKLHKFSLLQKQFQHPRRWHLSLHRRPSFSSSFSASEPHPSGATRRDNTYWVSSYRWGLQISSGATRRDNKYWVSGYRWRLQILSGATRRDSTNWVSGHRWGLQISSGTTRRDNTQ